ncbi:protein Tob2-like [Carassius auratus]|uniref:Protein Tob2-like n=1 Tax=Carassius auratus TaxID=7957 RepID=A0A6P6K2G7_CARAU|nr:protein Tob2-like [Carassius auratus]XP_026066316.1 protein Tob2-like [Carassius auratus]
MHLEVKVALNFIVSYLYNKLPRRRADLFGEELERILVSRFEGHWYPEAPLRGSAFRCLHLGAPRDPVVELAARRSGLDTEEVHANVPPELSIWIDPYEVSYQIGEKGAVKVLYTEDLPGLGGDAERSDVALKGDVEFEDVRSLGFNPEAQVFVPIGGQVSPVMLQSHSSSPAPLSTSSCPGLFGYAAPSTPTNPSTHSSNTSTPSPPGSSLLYSTPNSRPIPQPITFTTASFAATKFGSTKMKCGNLGVASGSGVVTGPQQRMITCSPSTISPPGLVKHKPLSLSMHSLAGPIPSQLSPNAKEFVFPASQRPLYFDVEGPSMAPFQAPHPQASFDPFSSPQPGQAVGIIGGNSGISFIDKPPFVEGLGYNLQYSSQAFQPVVLAN